jgi:hypothetical protein
MALAYSEPWRLSRDSDVQRRRQQHLWFRVYASFGVLTLLIAAIANGSAPHPFSLVLLLMIIGVVAVLARPVLGLYVIIFCTLIGDNASASWYPFAKNMSSEESIFYIGDGVIISTLEVFRWQAGQARINPPAQRSAPLPAYTRGPQALYARDRAY